MSVEYNVRKDKLAALHKTLRSALKEKRAERPPAILDITGLLKLTEGEAPDPDALSELHRYSEDLRKEIEQIYKRSEATLGQINQLKRKKENIERLIDCVTSVLELRRIAKNLGGTPEEVCTNIKTFYEVRDRTVYCERLIAKIEEDIKQAKITYKELFDKEAKLSNSDKIGLYSKILNLIVDRAGSV